MDTQLLPVCLTKYSSGEADGGGFIYCAGTGSNNELDSGFSICTGYGQGDSVGGGINYNEEAGWGDVDAARAQVDTNNASAEESARGFGSNTETGNG